MIVVRRVVKRKDQASFGFPNPFGRISEVNREAEYTRKSLQKDLDRAKSQGKNIRDPSILASIMQPTANKMKRRSGKVAYTRTRRTKNGKVVTEVVRR